MSVETRYPELDERTHVHLVGEALVYSLLHVVAAIETLAGDAVGELHIHAITGSPAIGSAPTVPATVEGVVSRGGVEDLAELAQVLTKRVAFPVDPPPSPLADGRVRVALAAALRGEGPSPERQPDRPPTMSGFDDDHT